MLHGICLEPTPELRDHFSSIFNNPKIKGLQSDQEKTYFLLSCLPFTIDSPQIWKYVWLTKLKGNHFEDTVATYVNTLGHKIKGQLPLLPQICFVS